MGWVRWAIVVPPHIPFSHVLLTCPPHMSSSHTLLTCPPHMSSSHVLLTCPPHMAGVRRLPSCPGRCRARLGRDAVGRLLWRGRSAAVRYEDRCAARGRAFAFVRWHGMHCVRLRRCLTRRVVCHVCARVLVGGAAGEHAPCGQLVQGDEARARQAVCAGWYQRGADVAIQEVRPILSTVIQRVCEAFEKRHMTQQKSAQRTEASPKQCDVRHIPICALILAYQL